MADIVELPCDDGSTVPAYLATPADGPGPGVVVVQEWWGLDTGVKEWADRLAGEGFVALAPDLYHGELAAYEELEKAEELMQAMAPERAKRDLAAAVDYLAAHEAVVGPRLGVLGTGLGAVLGMILANDHPDRIGAVAAINGYPYGDIEPKDWSPLTAAMRGYMAEYDDFFPPDGAEALQHKLREMGKDVTLTVYPDTRHGFMSPAPAWGSHDAGLFLSIWLAVLVFFFEELG